MTWAAKAEVFRRAFARGGDVEAALKAVEEAQRGRPTRRLTRAQREEMRRRRAAGEKREALALEFGVSMEAVRYHTFDVPVPPLPPETDPGVEGAAVALAGAELGLSTTWLADSRAQRGKPVAPVQLARRAVALALEEVGLPRNRIGHLLLRDWTRVFELLRRARLDRRARQVAAVVLGRLRGEQGVGEQAGAAA